MSSSSPGSGAPGTSEPPRKPPVRKSDRKPAGNVFWFLLIGIVLCALVFSFGGRGNRGQELKFSEFKDKIRAGSLNRTNVYDLEVGPTAITFQDQPRQQSDALGSNKAVPKQFTVHAVGLKDDNQKAVTDLLDSKGIEYQFASQPPDWQQVAYLLIVPVMFLLFFLYIFRRMSGPGSAMSFGRSRGRMYAQEDLGVTFADVAGIDEPLEELREIVEFLRNPGKYQALGGRIPHGVLLVGPPGTGKTLLAKAVAGEAGVPFFSLSGSDFVELFVGVGASRVRDLFAQAVQKAPSIIFIDEMDALGKRRGEGGPGNHDERDQTLNALLVEMDGFSSEQSVIVMGATNRPDTLDPALMRPGRFDRHVVVDRPDIKGREAILNVHARRVKLDDKVNLKHLARLTPGFVGADLANLVNEAALLAARKNKTCVTGKEFEEGIERVVAGLEKTTRIIPEEEKQRVAYHEIGHALVACILPNVDPVHKVSIIPRGIGALGYTLQRPEEDRQLITKTELQNRICVLMGGIAAEDIIYQESSTGPSNDLQRATDLARRMVTEFGMSPKLGRVHYSEIVRSPFLGGATAAGEHQHSEETIREIDLEVRRIVDQAYNTAHEVLQSRKHVVEHLTRDLLEREVMDADQIAAILDHHRTGPQLKPGTFVPGKSTDDLVPPVVRESGAFGDLGQIG